jgi:hypothetical protein
VLRIQVARVDGDGDGDGDEETEGKIESSFTAITPEPMLARISPGGGSITKQCGAYTSTFLMTL